MRDLIFLKVALWASAGTLFVVAALFFARFYRDTSDRLFVFFGLAFFTLGAQYWLLALLSVPDEAKHWLYLVRLVAFLLIVVAIADKNQRSR